jgi:chaperonin GroEL (HSP60 family)
MTKKIEHGPKAREAAVNALCDIAEVISATVGPAGRPILLSRNVSAMNSTVFHTKDGITVLRELSYLDPIYDAVHRLAVQATADTMINAGDGPQPLWSKVLTPNGFVEMKDVHVGMEVCGTNGTIQTVLGVFPKGEKEIFEVEFSNKRVVECCEDHLWTVVNATNKCPLQTKTTKELQKNYMIDRYGYAASRYYTPRTVVEFATNEDEIPLDPYLVGVLLGDGSLSGTGSIEMSLGEPKFHIIEKIKLQEGFSLTTTHAPEKNVYRVKIKGQNREGQTIHDVVESIGLLGTTSATKFIPRSYLYSSMRNRTDLLQGLIDTDGHVSGRGCFEFSSVSKELAEGVVDLCRSLGKTANLHLQERKEGNGSYSMRPIYRVAVSTGRKYGNAIRRITATGKRTEMQCIKVSNPDNLYITDNYIVTHNTSSTLIVASAFAKALHNHQTGNPQAAVRLFRKEVDAAIAAIATEAVVGESCDRAVALTSSNGDVELTDVILEALGGVSAFGTVIAEKNPMSKVRYQVDKEYGYQAGGGYAWNISLGISVSENAVTNGDFALSGGVFVVPYNGNIMQIGQLAPILNRLAKSVNSLKSVNLLIVAYECADDVANQLVAINRQNPQVKIFVAKTNPTAEFNGSWNQLNDIAAFSGATIVDAGTAPSWELDHAGVVEKVRVTPYKTFLSGRGQNHWIERRAEQNEQSAALAPTPLDREIILSRNASLTGGLVKLTLGGGLPGDLEEIAARADDAIRAVQACRRSGALPGCGLSYIRAAQLAGCGTEVTQALSSVHTRIMENYGITPLKEIESGTTCAIHGDKISTGCFLELGVADSFETVKSVIANGFALGSLVANLGGFCINADIEEIQKGRLLKDLMSG